MNRLLQPETVDLEIENVRLPGWFSDDLFEVRVQERLSMPTQCELYFRGPDLMSNLERREFSIKVGNELQVRLRNGGESLFKGEITAVEYSYPEGKTPEIFVRGYDLVHRLRNQHNVRACPQVDIIELTKILTHPLGVGVKATGRLTRNTWPLIIQDQQNDLIFLTAQTAAEGFYFYLHENVLNLYDLSGDLSMKPILLELGKNLFEAHIEVNAETACNQVIAQGWDPVHVTPIEAKARRPISGRDVPYNEKVKDSLGMDTMQGAGNLAQHYLINQVLADASNAMQLAQADLDRRYAATVTFSGKTIGNPKLRPAMPVILSGVAGGVAGKYILTGVTHILDSENGYTCEVTTEVPQSPNLNQTPLITLGLVTDDRDPVASGRVRTRLPAFNNIETDWMQVLYPGAGNRKGFYSLPAVGDRVLLVLPRSNAGQGIVLGGLSGDLGWLSNGIKTDESVWVTVAGQKIRMDAAGDAIRLENSQGAYIQLSGGNIVIAGSSVDFVRI